MDAFNAILLLSIIDVPLPEPDELTLQSFVTFCVGEWFDAVDGDDFSEPPELWVDETLVYDPFICSCGRYN